MKNLIIILFAFLLNNAYSQCLCAGDTCPTNNPWGPSAGYSKFCGPSWLYDSTICANFYGVSNSLILAGGKPTSAANAYISLVKPSLEAGYFEFSVVDSLRDISCLFKSDSGAKNVVLGVSNFNNSNIAALQFTTDSVSVLNESGKLYNLPLTAPNVGSTMVSDSNGNLQFVAYGSGFWNRVGNSDIDGNVDFIGTTNNAALTFKTNNIEAVRITSIGQGGCQGCVGIGTSSPTDKLHINGTLFAQLDNNTGVYAYLKQDGVVLNATGLANFRSASLRVDTTGQIAIDANDSVSINTTQLKLLINATQGENKILMSDAAGNATWQVFKPFTDIIIDSVETLAGVATLIPYASNVIVASGAIVGLDLTLPSSPSNGDICGITFTQEVSSLTFTGGTVVGLVTSPSITQSAVNLQYFAARNVWYQW